jgi:hypothetical protein
MGVTTMNIRKTSIITLLMATALGASLAEASQVKSWDRQLRSNRFTVLSDFDSQAVLDQETGLVWERAPRAQLRTFSGAFNSCYATEIGGRLGWRPPTMPEITSLLDRTQTSPPLPPGHPFDVSGLTRDVWTASAVPGVDPSQAFTQDMRNDGFLGNTTTDTELNYWCVRGGTGVEGR